MARRHLSPLRGSQRARAAARGRRLGAHAARGREPRLDHRGRRRRGAGAGMTIALETTAAAENPIAVRRKPALGAFSILGPLAVLGLLFVYPLVTVVQQSFQDRLGRPAGAVAWQTVLRSAAFREGLVNTITTAVGSTIGCVLLGTFIAIVLAFVPFPGSAAVSRLTTVILAFPSFFIALSFAVLYGRVGVVSSMIEGITGHPEALGGFIYTRWAVLLAEITFYTPFVVRPVYAGCQRMQIEQLRVASSL